MKRSIQFDVLRGLLLLMLVANHSTDVEPDSISENKQK
jgi:fucose 4-O-acetylase-like acetyltransferase